MREEICDALKRSYIKAQNYKNPDYRVISEEEIESIVGEMMKTDNLNVTYSADTNYSTCYQLSIMARNIPTPAQMVEKRINRRHLPGSYYGLFVNISWLAPFAMKFWNRFEKGKDPIFLLEPETDSDKAREKGVIEILGEHGIEVLSEEELEEVVPQVNRTLLEHAPVNVRHLLFAEYL